MRIKKLADGGLPPFVSYTNVEQPLPAYAGIGSSSKKQEEESSKSSSKSSSSGDIGLLTKDMQKLLMENGLPSDVKYFLLQVDVFGVGVDPLNPTSQNRIYLQILSMLPEIKLNKAEYDDAIKHAREKGVLDQTAVTSDGYIFVLTSSGKIERRTPFNVKKGEERLTNGLLAQLRAYQSDYAMDLGSFTNIVAGSLNIHDIEKNITDLIDKLGKISVSTDKYIKKDKSQQLLEGYRELLEQGTDGVYKISKKEVSSSSKVNLLLTYLSASLSKLEKAILANRAVENGLSGEEGIKTMIASLIQGRLSEESETKVDFDASQTTKLEKTNGLASENSNLDDIKSTNSSRFFAGYGDYNIHQFRMSDGTATYTAYGNQTYISKNGGDPMGKNLLLSELSLSDLNGGLDLSLVSFGGIPLNGIDSNKVLLDGDKIVAVELPYKEVDGRIVPEIDLMNVISKILKDNELLIKLGRFAEVNKQFVANGFLPYFSENGTTTHFYKRFAVIKGYADEEVIELRSDQFGILGEYSEVSDYETGDIVAQLKAKNKESGIKYTPSHPTFMGINIPFTSENLVQSMIFIPINSNNVTWFLGEMKSNEAFALDKASLIRQHLLNNKQRYKPQNNPF